MPCSLTSGLGTTHLGESLIIFEPSGDSCDLDSSDTTPDACPHPPDDAYDQWLVIRAQGVEERALRELVERWSPRLRRHAQRLTGDADGAADATQEAWLAVVRGLPRLNDPACFRRWAYQIVGRKCADWIRRRQRSRDTTTSMTEEPEAPTDDDSAGDNSDALRRALKRLANQDRVLLAMRYTDDLSLTEIAEAMGLPVGTVKSRLHHARQKLKRTLQPPSPPDHKERKQ